MSTSLLQDPPPRDRSEPPPLPRVGVDHRSADLDRREPARELFRLDGEEE